MDGRFLLTHPCRVRLPVSVLLLRHPYFYSRTLAGCDHTSPLRRFHDANFYSRTLAGCDYPGSVLVSRNFNFYSRTLAGCDVTLFNSNGNSCGFLLTHPCRVRPCLSFSAFDKLLEFLLTHPCRVRLRSSYTRGTAGQFLLTHPCRVRLRSYCIRGNHLVISTHAPLQGATENGKEIVYTASDFYSRTLAGCDANAALRALLGKISTHAPLQGATNDLLASFHVLYYFYSRTLAGCDDHMPFLADHLQPFLLTHPCRVRLSVNECADPVPPISTHAPL